MSDPRSITSSIAQSVPVAIHATNATYATNARDQDSQGNSRVYNRARGAVDNSIPLTKETFFQSDIDLAVFLATRKPNRVRHEKHRKRTEEIEVRDYNRETANKLAFIHGQSRTHEIEELATAFRLAEYKVTPTQTETRNQP